MEKRKVKPADAEKWALTMSKRFRLLCRHLMQTASRPKKPRWFTELMFAQQSKNAKLPDNSEQDKPDQEDPSEPAGTPDDAKDAADTADAEAEGGEEEYFYGYDFGIDKAWRTRSASPKAVREWTVDLVKPENCQPTDSMIARWPDNFQCNLAALTVDQYEQRLLAQNTPRQKKAAHKLDLKTHTGTTLTLSRRADKHTQGFYMMQEDGKQVLCCQLHWFGTSDIDAKAFAWIKEVAEGYARGDYDQGELAKLKHALKESHCSLMSQKKQEKQADGQADETRQADETTTSTPAKRKAPPRILAGPAPPVSEYEKAQTLFLKRTKLF